MITLIIISNFIFNIFSNLSHLKQKSKLAKNHLKMPKKILKKNQEKKNSEKIFEIFYGKIVKNSLKFVIFRQRKISSNELL